MALDPNTLFEESKCYLCVGVSEVEALKLALLRRWLTAISPSADTTSDGLLQYASCFRCNSNSSVFDMLELALLDQIANAA